MHLDPNDPLLAAARAACAGRGPAHDLAHVLRVARIAARLAHEVGADVEIARTAALLHELVNLPKDHPESHTSGDRCALAALDLLRRHGWAEERAAAVAACIRDHAWSKGAAPPSLEAAVLQDADRLDAIGAIGVARCFATAGELGGALVDAEDPWAERRPLDDKRFAADHFQRKLLHIGQGLHTAPARALAAERTAFLRAFLDQLAREVAG
jgi:uncharacterized protein